MIRTPQPPQVIPPLAPVVREIRMRSRTEFDFHRECASLLKIGKSMRQAFGGEIVVPRPLLRLSSKRLLVMEFVAGPTLAAKLGADVRAAVGDANFARLSARARGEEEDEGSPGARRATALERLRLVAAAPRLWQIRRGVRARLLLLGRAHGKQIFVDGCFNGDPHGGNVLVVPGGSLGLIDYGQVRARCCAASPLSPADVAAPCPHRCESAPLRAPAPPRAGPGTRRRCAS